MKTPIPSLDPPSDRIRGCCAPVAPPLPTEQAEHLTAMFKAVADPARVQLLHMLKGASAPICVCDFTAALDINQPTVSHHLAKLREAGLVTSFRRGIWAFYELRADLSTTARTVLGLIP